MGMAWLEPGIGRPRRLYQFTSLARPLSFASRRFSLWILRVMSPPYTVPIWIWEILTSLFLSLPSFPCTTEPPSSSSRVHLQRCVSRTYARTVWFHTFPGDDDNGSNTRLSHTHAHTYTHTFTSHSTDLSLAVIRESKRA